MPVEGQQYPVNLVVRGRRCLVVGGGKVAQRKIDGLLACDAVVEVVAPRVSEAIKERDVVVHEREYRAGDAKGFRLVVTATDSSDVDRFVYEDADAAGIWVNAADDPVSCSFTLPAVVRRGPLMVTVSTGGHSPALATWLKGQFADQLGPEYETLMGLLSEERERLKASGAPTEGLAWQEALDGGLVELVRAGDLDEVRRRLAAL